MELKSVPTEFKVTAKGEVEGYAAHFHNRDSYGDIIQPGAFTRTLASDHNRRVKVLWQHDSSEPIGKPLEMREDERGLFVRAKIAPTARGRDALVLFDAEIVNEMSIGYDALVDEYDDEKNARMLLEVKLWEFSPVTWAANELAKITAVKSASDLDAVLDRLQRIQWAKGKLESPRLRQKAEGAVLHLTRLLHGEDVFGVVPATLDFEDKTDGGLLASVKTLDPITDQLVASPSGTPPTPQADPDPVHSLLEPLTALKTRILATNTAHELRAFGETLKGTQPHG